MSGAARSVVNMSVRNSKRLTARKAVQAWGSDPDCTQCSSPSPQSCAPLPPRSSSLTTSLVRAWREKDWIRRAREEQQERHLQRVVEEPMFEPVRFLPQLPAAARIARETWAKDPTRPSRSSDQAALEREVEALGEVWVGTYVRAWQAPTAEVQAAAKLKRNAAATRGRAPNSKAMSKAFRLAGSRARQDAPDE